MSSFSEITLVMVDDNADEIFLTRRQVRQEGIVNHFESEKKPQRLLQTQTEVQQMGVDKKRIMILLDINMPRSNGFETLKTLRECGFQCHDRSSSCHAPASRSPISPVSRASCALASRSSLSTNPTCRAAMASPTSCVAHPKTAISSGR